jgi:hypothetical protein
MTSDPPLDLITLDRLITNVGTEVKRCQPLLTKYASALTSPTASYKFTHLQQLLARTATALETTDPTQLQTCITQLLTFK